VLFLLFCLLWGREVGVLTIHLLWRWVVVLAVLSSGEGGGWCSSCSSSVKAAVLAVLSFVGWGDPGGGKGGDIVDISKGYLAASCCFSVCTAWTAVC
jgi:hypothetical protein